MPYLDLYTTPLTAKTAAHLLRRATFGPTQAEITAFTGRTATEAVQLLLSNSNYNPPPPVDLDTTRATVGKPFLRDNTTPAGEYKPYDGERNFEYNLYIKFWWLGVMANQTAPPSLLDKLTLFWQNHFVTSTLVVDDYRFVWSYLKLLRDNALGNFRTLVTKVTIEPAMLRFLNGAVNEVGALNENYGRELQELFTVGGVDLVGGKNYTEDDVKAAARVLTGWNYTNYGVYASKTFTTVFNANKHDTTPKVFSAKYGSKTISTPATVPAGFANVGEYELSELISMLLAHTHTAKYICRKLYRWYVNPNVTPKIESNVIGPLATLFISSNWDVRPVIERLLTCQSFFDDGSIGSMIKSPADMLIGATRFFNQPVPVPDVSANVTAFKNLTDFLYWRMRELQLDLLDQPGVLGYDAYYQKGYSRNWLNTSTITLRNDFSGALVWRWLSISPTYTYGIDLVAWVTSLQTGFGQITTNTATPPGTPSITCVVVLDALQNNLFATGLAQTQKDFLIDKIMMMDQAPRLAWEFEWNQYRRTVTHSATYTAAQIKNARDIVNWRLTTLMNYLLRMAEYHLV
ncbi:MAG: DUF1800 domain-containing protein [Cytophagales bacterium]|nr:MAG: DUF1800 domain-containing protein [Cytophagales bacterium]